MEDREIAIVSGGGGGRLFGQSDDGGADSDVGGSTRRPAPDMRRYGAAFRETDLSINS